MVKEEGVVEGGHLVQEVMAMMILVQIPVTETARVEEDGERSHLGLVARVRTTKGLAEEVSSILIIIINLT